MQNTATFTNRLAHESSLYLRQHAHNPIDWYPWGSEALERAKKLDRPIFLSIGYSACHWCHVMAHESFENQEIAKFLNEHFISIKLDREERPDLDAIYMSAVQALNNGQGGWPMSVFLTPDLEPFFAGTYFPPDNRYGRPGFLLVLQKVIEAWQTRRADVLHSGKQIAEVVRAREQAEPKPGELGPELLEGAMNIFRRVCDPVHGGVGHAPKFPRPIDLRLLLRIYHRLSHTDALDMAKLTLDMMARGGMYDQIGGGFHRYSTDERWLVPHFEKMLYDNALLVPAYLEAFQITGDAFYRQIVVDTLDYVLREMTAPPGAFYSTQDADSEGVEGKFYVWSEAEIVKILGKEQAEVFNYFYDVSPGGNWEGHNILNCPKSLVQAARLLKTTPEVLSDRLQLGRQKLYEVRGKRVWPGRDEKILTGWNALMIAGFAQAGAVLEEPRLIEAAKRAAEFVLKSLRTSDGRLLRTCGIGQAAKIDAYLEDYAYLADALVTLYESTFEPRWLHEAIRLAEKMIDHFYDSVNAGFFFTSADHKDVLFRTKDVHDSSIPAANSMAVIALLRLAALTGRADFRAKAEATMIASQGLMSENPLAGAQMLLAVDFHLGPVEEVAIIGDPVGDETQRVLRAFRKSFRPNQVLALRKADADDGVIGLLKDKPAQGTVTTYICRNFACQAPLVGAEAVEKI
ncbi:MAG TPA: thioredoxin domain-containing protein [Gemmataceae bacterium]|nr:thioredoxin domain-containing protein [Gemmataceae bacterium]